MNNPKEAEDEQIQNLTELLLQEKGLVNLNSTAQKGGFGSVLFVEDQLTKKRFAVKAQSIINPNNGKIDEKKLHFCKQESSILESVKHKNVVEYHSDYVLGFYHFIQMNLCECSLDDWIKKRGNQHIPKATFLHFLHQILDGIEYLHSQNYVLRDLSTKNILITTDGVIKLCDFGLAQQIDQEQILASHIQSYNPKGVFIYFPPELMQQINNNNEKFMQSKKGDIWAFGICLSLLGGISFLQASQFNQVGVIVKEAPLLDTFCNSIIKYILNANPKERPTISEIRKYIYEHLNTKNMLEMNNTCVKSQKELEEYFNQRDLTVPITSYKEIEKQCLESQDKIESLLRLALIYSLYNFDLEKAQMYVLLSLEKDSQDPDVYLNQCEIYLQKNHYEQRINNSEIEYFIAKAQQICPNYWRVHSMKTRYFQKIKKIQDAKQSVEQGLSLNQEDPELQFRQILIQIKESKEDKKSLLQKAEKLEVKYKHHIYFHNLGYISQQGNETNKAILYYETQLQFVQNPATLNNLGLIFYIKNDLKKAKYYFEQALKMYPNNAFAKIKLNTINNNTYYALYRRQIKNLEEKLRKKNAEAVQWHQSFINLQAQKEREISGLNENQKRQNK